MHAGRTIFFLHIPKTGGVGMDNRVRANLPEAQAVRLPPIVGYGESLTLATWSYRRRRRLRYVSGHVYYGVHRLLPRPVDYITILREPVDRLLSEYSYIRGWAGHPLHTSLMQSGVGPVGYAEGEWGHTCNSMVRLLAGWTDELPQAARCECGPDLLEAAWGNVQRMRIVGDTADLAAFTDALTANLGLRIDAPAVVNPTDGRVAIEDLTAEQAGRIRAANALDVELYRRFTAERESLGVLVNPPRARRRPNGDAGSRPG